MIRIIPDTALQYVVPSLPTVSPEVGKLQYCQNFVTNGLYNVRLKLDKGDFSNIVIGFGQSQNGSLMLWKSKLKCVELDKIYPSYL